MCTAAIADIPNFRTASDNGHQRFQQEWLAIVLTEGDKKS